MRIVHWLFLVSVALFVSGIGFVIAGARTARAAPAVAAGPAPTPVASVKQIMKEIVGPSAKTVFDAVSTTVSFAGVEERQPRTDAEWEAVGSSAAMLIESGNLKSVIDRIETLAPDRRGNPLSRGRTRPRQSRHCCWLRAGQVDWADDPRFDL